MADKKFSEEQKGEFALKLLKFFAQKRNSIRLDPEMIKRELPNVAKAIDVSTEELKDFAKIFFEELLAEAFGE